MMRDPVRQALMMDLAGMNCRMAAQGHAVVAVALEIGVAAGVDTAAGCEPASDRR